VTFDAKRIVKLGDRQFDVTVTAQREGHTVNFGGDVLHVASTWRPGETVWRGHVGHHTVVMQIRGIPNGMLINHRGAQATAFVYTEREAAAARLMPVKTSSGSGKKVLCPMPGLVVSIAVAEGQDIKAGETLAVVEAMKMENVLRAERDGVIKTIHAKPGETLAVDATIMEFA
jgi:propionyl-CoA carboxylase alpha chain